MEKEMYFDLTSFGFQTTAEDERFKSYKMTGEGGRIFVKSFKIMPGIEIYYNDFQTMRHFSGEFNDCTYYQIAYCHSGVYESRIEAHRVLKLAAKEIMVLANISRCIDASMPLGYYKGINMMFYPDRFSTETKLLMEQFSVDTKLLFEKLMNGKRFSRFICNSHLMNLMELLFLSCEKGDLLKMKVYIIHVLVEFIHYDGGMEEQYRCLTDKTMQVIRDMKEYIEEHMSQHITIRELSEMFHISATSLKENFKILYGYSPYEFLKRHRMSTAAQLLQNTDLPVSEIGIRVGYENPSKFSAAFLSIYKVPPRAYRNEKSLYSN